MRAITATELRARLGETLNRASAGERILIQRDHRPLAVLVSPEDAARLDESAAERIERGRATLDRLRAFRDRMSRDEPQSLAAPDSGTAVRREREGGHGDHG
ncbi:MAG: type II toxin-antitoxin system Phd/YefM family antitoxin [Candidatus Limnocylindria bacterium]